MVVSMKMKVLWDIVPVLSEWTDVTEVCTASIIIRLMNSTPYYGGTYSKKTTWRGIAEDSHLHT
jgi:hypothetical protein